MSEGDITRDMNYTRKRGTHQYFIYLLSLKIAEKEKGKVVDFKRDIEGLQDIRERSDYNNEKIEPDESREALETSKALRKYLKETFA